MTASVAPTAVSRKIGASEVWISVETAAAVVESVLMWIPLDRDAPHPTSNVTPCAKVSAAP